MARIRCYLWGCWCDENSACPKCGAALYDADFIQIGRLDWMRSIRRYLGGVWLFCNRRCPVCNKGMRFTWHGPCCSEKCAEDYLPF